MRRCCLTALRQGCDNDLCSISRSGTFGRVSAKSPLITWGACIFVRGGRCLFSKSLTAGDTRVGAIGGQTICVRFGMCLCQNRRGSSVFLHTDADDNRWPSLPSLQPLPPFGYIYFNTQNGIEEKNATRSPSITDPQTLVFGRAPFP